MQATFHHHRPAHFPGVAMYSRQPRPCAAPATTEYGSARRVCHGNRRTRKRSEGGSLRMRPSPSCRMAHHFFPESHVLHRHRPARLDCIKTRPADTREFPLQAPLGSLQQDIPRPSPCPGPLSSSRRAIRGHGASGDPGEPPRGDQRCAKGMSLRMTIAATLRGVLRRGGG